MMSYTNVDLVSGYKLETSSGPSPDSPHPSISNDHVGPKIISISDDSDS